MNKIKGIFLSALLLYLFGSPVLYVKAEEQIVFSPTQIVVRENELGKRYTITISNTSTSDFVFNVEEKNAKKTNNVLELIDAAVTSKRLEIPVTEFKVKANNKYELTVRVKIFTNDTFDSFPSLIIKEKANPQNQTKILFQAIIPFIVQNSKGESKIESSFTLNSQNYTIDPKISVLGTVENKGTKFSNLSGTILISKNGKVLDEKEITSQISGLLFPGETRNYNLDWSISQDYFEGLGEYTVESRINNDETSNVSIMKISFIYIPKNLIFVTLGSILGISILISLVVIIKKPRKK